MQTFLATLCVFAIASLWPAIASGETDYDDSISRVNVKSPVFRTAEDDVGFLLNYSGWNPDGGPDGSGERFNHFEIEPKAEQMIRDAKRCIVLSVFLFDSLYADEDPALDIAGQLKDLLVQKKRNNPDMAIAAILDPSHKAYGSRVSPAEKAFREAGINVFYSDLIGGLKKGTFLGVRETAGHVSRAVDCVTFKGWGYLWGATAAKIPLPGKTKIDGETLNAGMAFNAMLVKANHRKILVADDDAGQFEALVASANPHNPSAYHVNTALSVKGAAAEYTYMVLREDIERSIRLGRNYAHWRYDADKAYRKSYLKNELPPFDVDWAEALARNPERPVSVRFVSEKEIPRSTIQMLEAVSPGDEVRIQMFYLSYEPVLEAILKASTVVDKPIRLLLDANKDSFNREKDGTPNRQVAKRLLEDAKKDGGKIEVRWYSTHGEQNHAKIMSISNPDTGKFQVTTGSCNWTGRNMAGVNMEANLFVRGAKKANEKFDRQFDLFWSNSDGMEYSLDYNAFSKAKGNWKWRLGEKPFYYSNF